MQTHPPHPPHLPHPPYLPHIAYVIAAFAAVAAFAVGVRWGTWAAGGSDSSCYLNESRLLSRGTIRIEEPMAAAAPWPRAAATFAPAGFRPSPVRNDSIVPICSPGLPLLMAGARALRISPMLVVPLCGVLAVWTTFLLARRLAGPLAGAASAVLLASSPIFLFQVVQPMTDVPAAAWWLLVAVLAGNDRDAPPRPFAAGIAAGVATLIRPNLSPLALIVVVYVVFVSQSARRAAAARFALGFAPSVVALALFQRAAYGSPLATGYGGAGDLFTVANVATNIAAYGRWMVDTHTPVLALGVLAPIVIRRAEAWLLLLIAGGTAIAYLPYQVFDAWWYLRFVLLAIALLIVLSTAMLAAIAQRVSPRFHVAIVAVSVAVLAILWVRVARQRSAFALQTLEHPFVEAGTFVADHLPERAVVVATRYTGSVSYYSGRPIIAFDMLDDGSLEPALSFVRSRGYVPFLLLDTSEETGFRERFGRTSEAGRLDWPPLARIGRTIRVYDPADRAPYLAGRPVHTIEETPRPRR